MSHLALLEVTSKIVSTRDQRWLKKILSQTNYNSNSNIENQKRDRL